MSTDSVTTRFDQFVVRLINSGVASPTELVGCSDDEIERLESKYDVRLPTSYRLFLQMMGHQSGRLFTHDHVQTSYSDVLQLTQKQSKLNQEFPEPDDVKLAADMLLISSRLGEQWLCISCKGQEDTEVLYFAEWDTKLQQSHPTVLEWLETWRAEAEEAIAEGYFDRFPRGTRG